MTSSYRDFLSEAQPGFLTFGGARMALLDIAAGFWGLRRQMEALIGQRLTDTVLQQAGVNGGASFARAFVRQIPVPDPEQALRDCIAAYQAAGFGRFEIETITWPIGRVRVKAIDTFESWMLRHHEITSDTPACAYTAGVLVGFVNIIANRNDVVCVERTCAAQEDKTCLFELLPAREARDQAIVATSPDPALGQHLNLLEMLFERMPMGIVVLDRDLRIRRFNPTWADYIVNYTPAAQHPIVPGTYYFDLDPGTEADVMPIFERVLNGETLILEALPIASAKVTSYWDAVLTPLIEDGEVVGILDVTTDATERVRTQRELEQTLSKLQEREAHLNSLLQSAKDFVVYRLAVDPTHPYGAQVVLASPSIRDLLGIEDPNLFDSWFDNLHPDDLPRIIEANQRALQQGIPYNESARIWHSKRRQWIWVHTMSTPVFNAQGELTHFDGLIIETTEQKQAEAALQHQIDFNNVVTTISTQFINLPFEDIDPGIEQALETVGTFTEVDRSYVFLFSEDKQTMDCHYEWCAKGIAAHIERLQDIPMAELAWSNAKLLRGEILHIPKVSDLPPEANAEKEEFSLQNIQTLVAVPMAYRGITIGFLGFDAVRNEKCWTTEDIKLLRIVGEIFVNALEHKRAQEALQVSYQTLEHRVEARTQEIERRRQMAEGLRDIIRAINANHPLEEVLDLIVRQAAHHLGAAACLINHLDDINAQIIHEATYGWPEELAKTNTLPFRLLPQIGAEDYRQAMLKREPTYGNYGPLPDRLEVIHQDATLPPEVKARRLIIRTHFAGSLSVPLIIGDEVYGGLILYYAEPQAFSNEQIQLAMTFAEQAALAIDNASLRIQAERAAVASERNRIARELHDSVSQALYGIALGTRTARTLLDREVHDAALKEKLSTPLDYVLSLGQAGLAEMRALIFELRPDALEKEGLVAALRKQTEALYARHDLAVSTEFCKEPTLPFKVKEALYRVAQEALNNIVKHANASHVTLHLTGCEDILTLEVEDDGVGFDPHGEFPGHLGLQTMKERIARLDGTLEIESAPGAGSLIRAKVPTQG